MNVIIVLEKGEWRACVEIPEGMTADRAYCKWERQNNYHGWRDKDDEFIIRESTARWHVGFVEEIEDDDAPSDELLT